MTGACRILVAIVGVVLAAGGAAGDEAVSDESAADLAAFIADQATSVEITDTAGEVSDAELQARLTGLASTAAELESRIRAGEDKRATRELYRKLRSERLAIIELGMSGKAVVPMTDAALFDQMLAGLKAYYEE